MSPQEKEPKRPDWLIKAYDNSEFLHSPAARTLRVLAELMEPATRFRRNKVHNTVVFFGSARSFPQKKAKKKLKQIEQTLASRRTPSAKLKREHEQAKRDVVMSRFYEDAVRLSEKLTSWFLGLEKKDKYFMVCSGGGPGIMEAANRGATNVKGRSVGLNISIPSEQVPNLYQTKDISCEFHYFFVRKFWFFYLAKALVIFPGGYGTLDELFELLTLIQTKKTKKKMPVVLYGKDFWNEAINFEALIRWGVISKHEVKLFKIFDDPDTAFEYLKENLTKLYVKNAIIKSR
ncbi:MAG: lysine decarboxylase [Candidatus Omnitrophica bacterium]|nr:lysine decarboxylase [Candidatus Omnitrophota bacterium]